MQARVEITTPVAGEWTPWPVNWSAIWVGALAALTSGLVFGLIGTAAGEQAVKTITSWKTISIGSLAWTVFASFLAFVIGGWVAGKIAGARHAEPGILHAAIAWLVAVPLILVALAAGAGSALGGWYGGLVASPFVPQAAVPPSPDAIRDTALAALTSLLIGLIGSVIGGWVASGEPMTFSHHRTRQAAYAPRREF
jgi:MFS family permease